MDIPVQLYCLHGRRFLCIRLLVQGLAQAQGPSTDHLFQLIREDEAAGFLGYEPRSLQGLRLKGGGPIFISPNQKIVRYRRIDLIEWSDRQARENTSQAPGALCVGCPLALDAGGAK